MLIASSLALAPPPPRRGGRDAPPTLPAGDGEAGSPRVLYVATSDNDGGVERYSVRMAAELHRRRCPISFACRPGEIIDRRCREAGLPTFPLHPRNSGDLRAARRLAGLLVAQRIDLLHVHSRRDYVPALMAVLVARRRQGGRMPRLLLHAHMLRALGEPPWLSGRLFGWAADGVVAVSHVVRERVLRAHALAPPFVRLMHNGVDVEMFTRRGTPAFLADRAASRGAWGIDGDTPVIGMVGRLDAKGQARLLEAAPALMALFPALCFVLVGAEGETGARAHLRAMAEAGGFAERLICTGAREDIPAVMAGFDVLAHLPTDESFGLALVEAMAAGLPTVATDIGGCREIVRDGQTGVLVPPDDSTALAQAFSCLLAQPCLRQKWGERGRRVAEQEFALGRQIDRLQTLYREFCPLPLPS